MAKGMDSVSKLFIDHNSIASGQMVDKQGGKFFLEYKTGKMYGHFTYHSHNKFSRSSFSQVVKDVDFDGYNITGAKKDI